MRLLIIAYLYSFLSLTESFYSFDVKVKVVFERDFVHFHKQLLSPTASALGNRLQNYVFLMGQETFQMQTGNLRHIQNLNAQHSCL